MMLSVTKISQGEGYWSEGRTGSPEDEVGPSL